MKYLFTEINERSIDGSGDLLSVSQYTGVTKRSDGVEDGDQLTNAASLEGYKQVKRGDLVTNIMLAWNGSLGFSPFAGITSPAYSIYRLKENYSTQFFHYLLRTDRYKSEYKRNSTGVVESRLRLYTDDFFAMSSLVPPIEEQTAIATFLDRKTALIDRAIAQKERLIELLRERQQILIQQAVTRGLDPNVELKDSGVEWLGEVPRHWEVIRLKNHIDLLTGFPFESKKYVEEGVKLARGINVKEGKFNWDDLRCWPNIDPYLEKFRLRTGDVLIAMDGSKVGKNFTIVKTEDLPVLLLQRVARLRTSTNLSSEFLYWNIANKSFLEYINTAKTDPMVPHISPANINDFTLALPPIEEQLYISSHINHASDKMKNTVRLQKRQITKLREFRATLVDAAVTGKVRVEV